jgi:hypothetical protein
VFLLSIVFVTSSYFVAELQSNVIEIVSHLVVRRILFLSALERATSQGIIPYNYILINRIWYFKMVFI